MSVGTEIQPICKLRFEKLMSNSAIYSQTRKVEKEEGLTLPLSSVKIIALNMAQSHAYMDAIKMVLI